MKRFVNVYNESSPNPHSMKYVLNFTLIEQVSLDFPDRGAAKNCPLAVALFDAFPFIQRVFVSSNFVTLTKNVETDWYEVNTSIRNFIRDYFEAEKPIFVEEIQEDIKKIQNPTNEGTTEDSDIVSKIKVLLDEYIRPAVEQDGGAISFHSFAEGVVKVTLQGSCSGCPSSTVTLKAGIENLMKRMIPEVKEVVAEGA